VSADIIHLRAPQSVIEHLERLLRLAKNGEITTVVYATVTPDGYVGSGYSIGGRQCFLAVAAARKLAQSVERFAFDD
jgi:hypothetical protein